ncbi:hypothetical protein VitviT2T_011782 [Vitis vinifera]|uniref:Receptor-like protein 12 n=2 Tax=Vitis vinifera TaxID=29760 RepID=A0ABY9CBU1_VITVI|nr:hypothetical protein VitviT2T_011782 [Vitis vinifera]
MHVTSVSGECLSDGRVCLEDEVLLLLQLKSSLIFNTAASNKLVSWIQSADCCSWGGVTWDATGRVVSLDLSSEFISGELNSSSSIFSLQYLQSLNLANNTFSSQIPAEFHKLGNLNYLNLSNAGFSGQIPIEISYLTRLVTIDLSSLYFITGIPELKLENPNLTTLVQNLKELRELHLSGVNISAKGKEWCQSLSSSVPNLQALSLSRCFLSGPIDSSLEKLQYLSRIRLDGNNFSSPVPEFLAKFQNLTCLRLSFCGLYGTFPEKIFQVPTLQILDIENNMLLEGSLPEFPLNGALETLILSDTKFSGKVPDSIGNLKILTRIELARCNFSGPIPNSMADLTQLFNILLNASSSVLHTLDLSSNNLEGPIPESVFELQGLYILDLSSNKFNGTVELSKFQKLGNLTTLSLSYNNLWIIASGSDFIPSKLPHLTTLKLASCQLGTLPDLSSQSRLSYLDLSENQIQGEIPKWIWKVGNGSLIHLNLSLNLLEDLPEPSSILSTNLLVLDLHSNQLHGRIPTPPSCSAYVDYSNNSFTSFIPDDIGTYISLNIVFMLSKNNITGIIPESICNASYLSVLDLSDNALSGKIPSCLIEIETLAVLNLGRNKFSGIISGEFPGNCVLQTLDLNGNLLEGKIPVSLAKCKELEVLNLGNNQMDDNFPCWLKNISNLRVLVLRANKLHGPIGCPNSNSTWPMVQIVDLAHNNFSGELPAKCFLTWRAMMAGDDEVESKHKNLEFEVLLGWYYQDAVRVTSKGQELELVKILTLFTSIDLSRNNFEGEIPEVMGDLTLLYVLNLSGNGFTGRIPSSLGQLRQLESLDLSMNKLSGEIPTQLASLNFL